MRCRKSASGLSAPVAMRSWPSPVCPRNCWRKSSGCSPRAGRRHRLGSVSDPASAYGRASYSRTRSISSANHVTPVHDDMAIKLEDVVITEVLQQRPRRSADFKAENDALRALAQHLIDDPETLL